ncbi:hypothetical protein AB6A23_16115 [Paenibacillus tarimensis]
MSLIRAYIRLNRNPGILLIPILIDALALIGGLSSVSFYGEPASPFKIIFETGLPSLSHILEHPVLINTFKFIAYHPEYPPLTWAFVLAFILFQSFLQGGYINRLYSMAGGDSDTSFSGQCLKYWLRFFLLSFILLFFQMSVVTLLVFMLHYIGMFIALSIFIVLRVIYIYFEFSLVVHNASFGQALRISGRYFKDRTRETYVSVAAFFILGGVLSYVVHAFWSIYAILLFIFIYGYLMTGVQLALMTSLVNIRRER